MIHEISSSLSSFKALRLKDGLNILIADRTDTSTERQTRNRAGKSSLIEVVHFVLGANAEKESIFRNRDLKNHFFELKFALSEAGLRARRSGAQLSRIQVEVANGNNLTGFPEYDLLDEGFLSNEDWKDVLGHNWFRLPTIHEVSDNESHRPSFRSLFSYFARRDSANGFLEPVRHTEEQSKWDQQVALTYLLGLDWTVAQRLEHVRRQDKALAVLRRAAKEGPIGKFIPKASELQSELILREKEAERVRTVLETFEVLPEYRELENEASQLSLKINALINENTLDAQLRDSMEDALRTESTPEESALVKLYEEAGVVLPGLVKERLNEVRAFHRSVITNRRRYLEAEIFAAQERMSKREDQKRALDQRRAEIMRLLRSKGALDQFQTLQREQTRLDALVESLKQRHHAAQQLESNRVQLEIERRQLESRLRLNLEEQAARVRDAIRIFEDVSESLYEDAGNLVLNPGPNGLEIEIHIQGQRSKGIQNMQIFCFDMMLMRLASEKKLGPGFLIHDSHLFDGVDERQVARALSQGARHAVDCGWQYIVTMNSDAIPDVFPDGFNLNDHMLPVRLTDARDDGGLFGIRF